MVDAFLQWVVSTLIPFMSSALDAIWWELCYLYNFTIFGWISYPIDPLIYDWRGALPIYLLFIAMICSLWFFVTCKGRIIRIGKVEWTFKTNLWEFMILPQYRWDVFKKYGCIRKRVFKNRKFFIGKKDLT